MRIAFGTDERTDVTDAIVRSLGARGHEVEVVGDDVPWPDAGRGVGELVAAGACDLGVVCCWTGTGTKITSTQ